MGTATASNVAVAAARKALMRIANGIELDLRALRREIEARRDAQQQSRERLGEIISEAMLFHLFRHYSHPLCQTDYRL